MAAGAATLLPGLLEPSLVARCLDALERRYADPETRDSDAFSVASSSFRLGSVPELRVVDLVAQLFAGPVAALCRRELGTGIALIVDECWARRQYPLKAYPTGHAAHSWHQDGALGLDFLAVGDTGATSAALLPMVTCWIALTPCGDDAPGLELAGPGRRDLLPPDALAECRIRTAHRAEDCDRPVLAAGDALVFTGGLLHRTHVTRTMTRARTSIEMRFVATDRLDDRLRGRHLLALH